MQIFAIVCEVVVYSIDKDFYNFFLKSLLCFCFGIFSR